MKKDLFEKVPEFLVAFKNIKENGFFENLDLSVNGLRLEGKIGFCSVKASGCISEDEKYIPKGCGVLIDPEIIVENVRKIEKDHPVQDITVKVETNNWPLYDKKGENIIGSKGRRIDLFLLIIFKL